LPAEIRVLVGVEFIVAVGYGIVAPALSEFARSFDVGVTAASAVVSGFAVFRLLFAPVSGRLLHRFGERRLFSGGVLVVALSSAACAFAADYDQLLAFRAIGGIGSTMFTVAAASLLIKLSPPDMRGRTAAASATGFLLGTIAGPLVGGAMIVIDIRAPFMIYAGLLGLAALVIVVVLRGRAVEELVRYEAAATMTFGNAVRSPIFRACLVSNFLNGWTVYGVRIALVPLFVVDMLGSSGWSGVALTAFALGTAGTLTLGGHLADQWGRQPCAVVGSVVVATSTALLGFTSSPVEVLVACMISGAGTGLLAPPENAAVADVLASKDGDVRGGPALAGYQMVGDVGAILGPLLTGLIVELGGYQAAFALTAALAAGAAWSWWRAPARYAGSTGAIGLLRSDRAPYEYLEGLDFPSSVHPAQCASRTNR
jgi:MFS family permease